MDRWRWFAGALNAIVAGREGRLRGGRFRSSRGVSGVVFFPFFSFLGQVGEARAQEQAAVDHNDVPNETDIRVELYSCLGRPFLNGRESEQENFPAGDATSGVHNMSTS